MVCVNHLHFFQFFILIDNVGAGEREARIASDLVARRHFRWARLCGQ